MRGTASFDITEILATIALLAVGVMGWFLRRHFERFDKVEEEYVRHRDLKEMLDSLENRHERRYSEMRDDADQRHEANLRSIDRLTEQVHGNNEHVNDLFKQLLLRDRRGGR